MSDDLLYTIERQLPPMENVVDILDDMLMRGQQFYALPVSGKWALFYLGPVVYH